MPSRLSSSYSHGGVHLDKPKGVHGLGLFIPRAGRLSSRKGSGVRVMRWHHLRQAGKDRCPEDVSGQWEVELLPR